MKKIDAPGFTVVDTVKVWRNLPPANVMIFQHSHVVS